MADLSKETLAAYDYVDRVVDTADDKKNLMWHGWALRDAFVAGAMWQSAQQSVQPTLLHAGCGGEIVQTKPYCKKCRVVEPPRS